MTCADAWRRLHFLMTCTCRTFVPSCAGGLKSPGRRPLIIAGILSAAVCQGSKAVLPGRSASSKATSPGSLPAGLLLLLRWRPEAASPACRRGLTIEDPIHRELWTCKPCSGAQHLVRKLVAGKSLDRCSYHGLLPFDPCALLWTSIVEQTADLGKPVDAWSSLEASSQSDGDRTGSVTTSAARVPLQARFRQGRSGVGHPFWQNNVALE